MPNVIDEAWVEIVPLLSRFRAETKAGLDQIYTSMSAHTRQAAAGVSRTFEESGRRVRTDTTRTGRLLAFTFGAASGVTHGFARSLLPVSLALVGVAEAAIHAVRMTGDFDSQLVRLTTAAGESVENIEGVRAGILDIARETGTGLSALSDSAYLVESAGYHGRDALNVLRAAAQGAKIDLADAGVVGNALTTAMNDLLVPTSQAATVMSQLVAAVGHGKMTMNDLSTSLHSVLPNAVQLHLNFAQVGGAMATMTAQGISARQGAENLNHAILSLANPTAVQTKAMAAFGLNSSVVARDLGKSGLTGTLDLLSHTILQHMGPAGLTLTNVFNTSQVAAGKANETYRAMSPALQKLADEVKRGTLTMGQLRGTHLDLTLRDRTLIQQWAVLQRTASGFNDLLKSGSPHALTYAAALSKMTGGQVGLQVALHLAGPNMATYRANVAAIQAAHAEAGNSVEGWAERQKTFNQRLGQFKEVVLTGAVSVTHALLPALTDFLGLLLRQGPTVRLATTEVGAVWHDTVLPAIRGVADYVRTYLVPTWLSLWRIFSANVLPVLRLTAGVVGTLLRVAIVGLVATLKVLGVVTRDATGWLADNAWAVRVIAGVVTVIMLPALVALTVRTAAAAAAQVVAWASAAAGAVSAAGSYVVTSALITTSWVEMAVVATASGAETAAIWLMYQVESARAAAAVVASGLRVVGSWVAQGAAAGASALRVVAAWATQAATAGASAAVALAALAVQGARWVWLGAVATASAIRVALAWLIAIDPLALVIALIVGVVLIIIKHWGTIHRVTVETWHAVARFVVGVVNDIWQWIQRTWDAITKRTVDAWHTVRQVTIDAAKAVLSWLKAHWTEIIATLAGPLGWAVLEVVRHWREIKDTAVAAFTGLIDWFKHVPGWIAAIFVSAWNWLYKVGKDILTGLGRGLKTVWVDVLAWGLKLPDQIKGWFRGAINWLKQAGKDVLNGIWQGMQAAWHAVLDWFKGIPKSFLKALNIGSPPPWSIEAGKWIMKGLLRGLTHGAKDVRQFFIDRVKAVATGVLGPVTNAPGVSGMAARVRDMAQSLRGWGTGAQWNSLYALIMGESGFNNLAQNPTSSAFGLFQFLDSTWAGVGINKTADWVAQTVAGLKYIAATYGDPVHAYGAWLSRSPHWYESGAWKILADQLAVIHRGEMVVPAGPAAIIRGETGGATTQSRGASAEAIGAAVARALAGLTFQFDPDGVVRLVNSRNLMAQRRGVRR